MARNFNTLLAKMSPERRKRIEDLAQDHRANMALDELREARQLTQTSLADILGINQAAVSKMERRTDMYISTLRSVIRAMGGRLRIEAVFPEGKVEIDQFREKKRPAASR
jgi:transcriptional regulator with XRE-family HTH domain